MIPPDNTQIYETEIGIFWLDADGILCQNSKATPRTMENMKKHIDLIRQITNNAKVCTLADGTHAAPSNKEIRDFVKTELKKSTKAMAILSSSPLGTLLANFIILFNRQDIPIKLFTNEKEAKEWLRHYL